MTLENIKFQQKVLKKKYKEEEQKEHKKFIKKHSKILLLMDILLICSLIFNIGAICITHFLVQKDNYSQAQELVDLRHSQGDLTAEVSDYIVYYETNPTMQENMNYVETPEELKQETNKAYYGLIILIIWWASIIFAYIYMRMNLYANWHLYVVLFSLLFISIATSFDFIFDLAILIARLMFG